MTTDTQPERSRPMADDSVSEATCERCLKGIDGRLDTLDEGLKEIKEIILEDKRAASRRVTMWISAVGILSATLAGLLSNLGRIAAMFRTP